jgi:hypothetical protein
MAQYIRGTRGGTTEKQTERTEMRERGRKGIAHGKQHSEHDYMTHRPAPLISVHTVLEGHQMAPQCE